MSRTATVSLLLFISAIPALRAADSPVATQLSPRQPAFARYTVSLFERDPFTEAGPVAVFLQASLPDLYKGSDLVAIRDTGANEKADYTLLYLAGDATVEREVVPRYFEVRDLIENQRVSSILITPANYRFRFRRELTSGIGPTFVYDIEPRKKRAGLIKGQLWIDGKTGLGVLVKGRINDKRGAIDFVRETEIVNGAPVARVTHANFADRTLGRAKLSVVEYPVVQGSGGDAPPHLQVPLRSPLAGPMTLAITPDE